METREDTSLQLHVNHYRDHLHGNSGMTEGRMKCLPATTAGGP
jgi:hypothetical protein